MEKEDRLAVVKDTLKNIDSITIADYVEISKKNELDNNFKKLTGHDITVNGEHYPWVPIEYVNSLIMLDKTQKIPDGFEFINVICAKHIGVAYEIICYAKIDKDRLEKEVEIRAKETRAYPDTHPDSEVMNEFHARLKYLEGLQATLEGFMKPLVPGIFLSTNRNLGKNSCPSFLIYRLDDKYNPLKVEQHSFRIISSKVGQVRGWIEKFTFETKNEEWGPSKYSDLSFLNWNVKEPFSLIKEDFIIGHGRSVKPDEMGAYTNQYIILGLKDIDIRDLGSFESVNLHHLVVELSKFLLPVHWIRHRFKELEGHEKDVLETIEFPTLKHDKKHKELSQDLEQLMKTYDDENRKRAQRMPLFSNIEGETKCLKSLREGLDKLRGEEEEFIFGYPNISSTILKDIDFWFDEVSEKIEDVKSKQLSRIQYLRDQINATTSFLNVRLANSVNTLTLGIYFLTAMMVILTILIYLKL